MEMSKIPPLLSKFPKNINPYKEQSILKFEQHETHRKMSTTHQGNLQAQNKKVYRPKF